MAGYLFYISVKRLFVADLEAIAFENAYRIISLESTLHLFWEADIQGWLLDHHRWVVILFNFIYTFAFFPVLIPAAIVLFIFRYRTYVFYRNVFLVSYTFTWLIYLTFPAAPPRLVTQYGFVDTIERMGPAFYNTKEAMALYNQFSAMPSMHFGWSLLFAIIFLRSRHLPLKLFGIVYPGLSLGAILITANHYVLDAIVGGAIIVASYGIYLLLQRRALSPVAQLVPSLARAGLRRAYPPLRPIRYHSPNLPDQGGPP
ncbi:MAG: phosphatase PAP2 family protein [Dehalococcoidia bacterium]